jgi:carboxyl-terminal processing protease
MRRREFIVAACAFILGQAVIVGLQWVQGRVLMVGTEAGRRADEYRQILTLINRYYVRESDASIDKLSRTALKSMVRSLDPHSEFLVRDEYEEFRAETSQEFGGIGVQIEMRDRRLTVVAPMAGTPGDRAGLLRGDQFMVVDDRDMEGLSQDECLALLRGRAGTKVNVTVFRPRTGETLQREMTREIIKVQSVPDVRMIAPRVGYVRIVQFGERTGAEFVQALDQLEAAGMNALVLDLRDNPGGLLSAAVAVAEPFFNKSELVVYTQGRTPESREDIRANPPGRTRRYPVAVLTNTGSASASEIVAGTLRDTGRAVIVGEKSFGKGSVQSVLQLNGSGDGLRLTTALYYLPSGVVINGIGVEPHIPVTLTADEDRRLAIQRNRLALMTAEEFEELYNSVPLEDRQLTAAVDALRGVLAFTPPPASGVP